VQRCLASVYHEVELGMGDRAMEFNTNRFNYILADFVATEKLIASTHKDNREGRIVGKSAM